MISIADIVNLERVIRLQEPVSPGVILDGWGNFVHRVSTCIYRSTRAILIHHDLNTLTPVFSKRWKARSSHYIYSLQTM